MLFRSDSEGVLPTSHFNTPLSLNASLGENDAQCVKYGPLEFGSYYYDREVITGDNWIEPEYNDQFSVNANSLDNFFPYSGELFTPDTTDDEGRDKNADGHIILNKNRPDRTLVVLNTFTEPEQEVCSVVSDTLDLVEGDGGAVETWQHQSWIDPATYLSGTIFDGASWIWDAFHVADPSTTSTRTFIKEFDLDGSVSPATLWLASDNSNKVWVNGEQLSPEASGEYNFKPGQETEYDVSGKLHIGVNEIEVEVTNWAQPGGTWDSNPAGLLYRLEVPDASCIELEPNPEPTYECSDGIDNDQDGLIDDEDPGCYEDSGDSESYNPFDDDEYNEEGRTAIVVKKVTDSPGSETFNFQVAGDGWSNFTLGHNSEKSFDLDPGEYSVDEISLPGTWKLDSVSCTGGEDNNAIHLDEGEVVTCTFSNAEYAGGGGITRSGGGEGEVLGEATTCGPYLFDFIRLGADNDPIEVMKLESFLNQYQGENLPIDGVYDEADFAAVERFQTAYWQEVLNPWVPYGLETPQTPTGYVYKTTRRWINMLKCPDLGLTVPPLP